LHIQIHLPQNGNKKLAALEIISSQRQTCRKTLDIGAALFAQLATNTKLRIQLLQAIQVKMQILSTN
jgi:hypothetical protein